MLLLKKYALSILILFHCIGFVGIAFINKEVFANLTMMNLLLSLLLVAVSHQGSNKAFIFLFLFTWMLGYAVELLGIETGFPFGNYQYGHSLGPRLFDVPIIIGVNWFLMVMGGGYLALRFFSHKVVRVVVAALVMVLVDVLIETVAPALNYWYWKDDIVPLANFVGWFAVALIMQIAFVNFMSSSKNKLAIPYIITVALFFGMLILAL